MLPIILAIEDDDDREFMITVYTELHPLMKSTAKRIVKDSEAAEDIVQDTIVDLIDKLVTIRGFERKWLVSYIKQTVKNTSLNYCKKKKLEASRAFAFEDVSAEEIPDTTVSTIERLEMAEEYEQLGRVIKCLPERERELLYLKYGLRYDDEAIGKLLGLKKDSVRQYLTRARRLAKEQFLNEGENIG